MYNKYFEKDDDAFSEFYRRVEYDNKKDVEIAPPPAEKPRRERGSFDIKRLLKVVDVEKMGILPLVLLLLLLIDADEEEKFIIIALAVVFGI